jgi:NAD+ synthase
LNNYLENSGAKGFIVGISGGIDSAVTSTLCAMTGKPVFLLSMPIRQEKHQYERALSHMKDMELKFSNVSSMDIDLTGTFDQLEVDLPNETVEDFLAMANTRSRLRMTTLYAVGQANRCLVAGTGNKVEDFGVGFFTKYGDGGVDLSPIADLKKSEVWELGREIGVRKDIIEAKPTDGLWAEDRSDEDQIGATYPELEWAMDFEGDESPLSDRQKEVLKIYRSYHRANRHKMIPIPVCTIPDTLR